jgi:hypothetical protein
MAALDVQPGELEERIWNKWVIGMCLRERVEPLSGLLENLLAVFQVDGVRRLLDETATRLVFEERFQVGRRRGVGFELGGILLRQIVVAQFAQTLNEADLEPRLTGFRVCGLTLLPFHMASDKAREKQRGANGTDICLPHR